VVGSREGQSSRLFAISVIAIVGPDVHLRVCSACLHSAWASLMHVTQHRAVAACLCFACVNTGSLCLTATVPQQS
jgi:hypothetical protein